MTCRRLSCEVADLPVQGVVAESTLLLDRLQEVVKEFHKHGLYLFTYGEVNNVLENYNAQKSYGLDGIILDDVARMAKVCHPLHKDF